MKGFQITISSQQLLGAITKVNVLKGEYILLEATNRFEAKKSPAGMPYFRMAMRFSMAATNGAAFVEVDCNYMPYEAKVENEGTSTEKIDYTFLDDPCIDTSRIVFDAKQIAELAKVYGDNEEILLLNCFVERKLCTVQNRAMKGKAQTITTDITLPMIEKDISSSVSGEKIFAEAKMTSGALKKVHSESIANCDSEDKQSGLYFGFGKKLEAFILDSSLLYSGTVKTAEYSNLADNAAFYPIKRADFHEIISTIASGENVKVSLRGEDAPRYFEFRSLDSGATYVLPIYKDSMNCKSHDSYFNVLKLNKRKVSVAFGRADFVKAISLLKIGYSANKLRFVLSDGDTVVLEQAKDKGNSISIKGSVKISGRANYGEHYDPAEGPVLVEFIANTFEKILKGFAYKSEGEGKVETVRLTIFDLCTRFDNADSEETMFIMNCCSQEQQDEFKAAKAASAEKAKAVTPTATAAEEAAVTESESSNQSHPTPVTDVTPDDVADELEQKLA